MLIEFFGKNFGCFRDEFRLSMLATDIDPGDDRGIVEVSVEGDDEPLRLLRCAAIYGPNASGKSTIIRAADTLGHLIKNTRLLPSDAPLWSYEPFMLGLLADEPVLLGLGAVISGRVYKYEVEFDRTRFLRERLECLSPEEAILIDRVEQEVGGVWTKVDQFKLLLQGFRPNALLLSLADAVAHQIAQGITVGLTRLLGWYDPTRSFSSAGSAEHVAKRVGQDPEFRSWLQSQLTAADTGVVDIRAKEYQKSVRFVTDSPEDYEEGFIDAYRLSLLHETTKDPVPLPYSRESMGTRRIVDLAPLLYDLAHDDPPRAAFVDELDASMHPTLLEGLVRHFNCELSSDRVRGQLIFAAHETGLMDDEARRNVLRRDQVYFTEKDTSGAARLYSLAEFKERNNLNIRRRYLQGRYGALPALGSFSE